MNLHLTALGTVQKPELPRLEVVNGTKDEALKEVRNVFYEEAGWRETQVFDRELLGPDVEIQGPAIVEEPSAATVLYPGQTLTVDAYGNLLIDTGWNKMTAEVNVKIDPFTLEIVKDSLIATGDEMFLALARTSMSPIIYEVLDYASGLTDSKGQLLTQGNGVTGFIGMLTFMVKQTLKKFGGEGDLKPGDIIIINDPYGGEVLIFLMLALLCQSSTERRSSLFLLTKPTGQRSVGRIRARSAMMQLRFSRKGCNSRV